MHGQGTNWSQPLHNLLILSPSSCHQMTIWNTEFFSPQKNPLTITFVHLHSNIDSLVQRNCLVLYFDERVFIFYNIIYSAVRQSKQCNEWNKHSWEREREIVQEICGECSAVVVILWLNGLQTELLFVTVLLSNVVHMKTMKKWVNSFILGIFHFDKLFK